MYDSFGDGWNGGTYQLILGDSILDSGTFDGPSFGQIAFGINQEGCELPPVWGCTDAQALNYNPYATADDGSCQYPEPPAINDLCANAIPLSEGTLLIDNTNATQNEGIWGDCWGIAQGEGEQSSIWYTFTTPSVPAGIHIESSYDGTNTFTDTQFGIIEECGGEMIYCDGNAGEGLMSAFNFACGELQENTTYILMVDGWNGDNGTCYLTYSVDTTCANPVPGCTDPEALNYNPDATVDDGTCQYEEGPCESNEVILTINTVNWAGEMSWDLVKDGLQLEGDGNYQDDNQYTYTWCLDDGCYLFEMLDSYGDGWNGGTYSITSNDSVLASGTLAYGLEYGAVHFGVNQEGCAPTEIYGCTDSEAINYNPEATMDDGSCIYENNCTPVFIVFDGLAVASGTYVFASQNAIIQSGTYTAGSDFTIDTCLYDGCYSLMYSSTSDDSLALVYYSVFVNNEMTQFDFFNGSGQTGSTEFSIGAGCDSSNVVYGCTDPTAINYNPEATTDDGSCIYVSNCDISFTVLPDSLENVVWILPSGNIADAVSVLWDFGDGITSSEVYPQHTYEDEGPYTLCLTVSFVLENSDSCSVTYCTQVSGSDLEGPGFGPNGFTINVTNNANPTGIDEKNANVSSIEIYGQIRLRISFPSGILIRII